MKTLRLWVIFLVFLCFSNLICYTNSDSHSSYEYTDSYDSYLEREKERERERELRERLESIAKHWSETFSSYPRCNFSVSDDKDLLPSDWEEACNSNYLRIAAIIGTDRFGPVCLKTWKKDKRVEEIFAVEYESSPGQLDLLELKIGNSFTSTSCHKYALYVEESACLLPVSFVHDLNLISTHHTLPKILSGWFDMSVWQGDKETLEKLARNATNVACYYSNYDVAESTAYRYCKPRCYDNRDIAWANRVCIKEDCYCTLSYKRRFIVCNSITWVSPVQYSFSNGETRIEESKSYIDIILPDAFSRYTALVRLKLNYGKLRELNSETFRNLTHLNYLNLDYNRLKNLPVDIFDDLVNLKTLLLSYNRLKALPEDVFRNLNNLRKISLAGNRLKLLPKLYGKLKVTINVKGNKLISLRNDCFAGFVELTHIHLNNNSLTTLPELLFEDTVSLEWLNLSVNSLAFLPSDVFSTLKKLEALDLSKNQLTNIPPTLFSSTHSVKYLFLNYNNLLPFDTVTFESLSQLMYLNVKNSHLSKAPSIVGIRSLEMLVLSHNNLTNLNSNYFSGIFSLIYLSVEYNYVGELVEGLFKDLHSLQILYFNDNLLKKINRRAFGDHAELKFVSFANNHLKSIPVDSFAGLINLASLDIQQNYLHNLQGTFDYLKHIQTINASYNSITTINTIINSSHSVILDLRENTLSWVKKSSFKFTKWVHFTVLVDESATCCFVDNAVCLSTNPPPVYLTCNRMLESVLLHLFAWFLGLFAILFNFIVFYWRIFYKQDYRVQSVLIANLSVSDFMMGINMILLAATDAYYTDYFSSFSEKWRNGVLCKMASILSILSSEVSVFLITFITIDRWKGIKHALNGANQISLKSTKKLILLIWMTGLILSVTPTFLTHLFGIDIYEISEVCVGLPMVKTAVFKQKTRRFKMLEQTWSLQFGYTNDTSTFSYRHVFDKLVLRSHVEFKKVMSYATSKVVSTKSATYFSLVTFLGFNLICFILVAVLYLDIFITIRKTSKASDRTNEAKVEMRRAIKMFLIVFTDFCTWVPLVIVCILAQFGVIEVDPQVYAWTVAFILPINSAINPFLYTLVTVVSVLKR